MALQGLSLSPGAYRVMQHLYQAGGFLTMGELKRAVPRASEAVDELVSHGVCQRNPRPLPWSEVVTMHVQ